MRKAKDAVPLGFEVTALGVRDEYVPQVSALLDIKDEIVGYLFGVIEYMPEYMRATVLERVNDVFKKKIEELKQHVIKEAI